MNFIKKNIIFSIVVAITLLGSLFLIYMDWTLHESITEANATTTKNYDDFNKAFGWTRGRDKERDKKIMLPVDSNIEMIKSDTEELRKKTAQLQRIFGNPYRKNLLRFAAALKVTEDDLLERMKKLYNDDNEKNKSAEVLIPKLFAGLEKDKKISAADIKKEYEKFISAVQMETVEDFPSLSAGYDILGEALGLSRTMSSSIAHVYLRQMQRKILSQRLIPGVKKLEVVENFTFNQFVQTFPSPENVVDILNTMPIYEDIFRRMSASRLENVTAFSRLGQPVKFGGDKYMSYEFSTTVTGTIDSVRDFINSLLDAYKENRVYVITWVSLSSPESSAEVDAVKKIYESNSSNSLAQNDPQQRGSSRAENSGNQQVFFKHVGQISESEAEMQQDYGSVLIGKNRNINAVLRFKYYRFIGERLKK